MINFTWKITEVLSENDVLQNVKYEVIGEQDGKQVSTEGYAALKLPQEVKFKELLERELLSYLRSFYIQGDVNLIESRLAEQLDYLNKNMTTKAPWHIDTFTIE
jgi:hypothetical protein